MGWAAADDARRPRPRAVTTDRIIAGSLISTASEGIAVFIHAPNGAGKRSPRRRLLSKSPSESEQAQSPNGWSKAPRYGRGGFQRNSPRSVPTNKARNIVV